MRLLQRQDRVIPTGLVKAALLCVTARARDKTLRLHRRIRNGAPRAVIREQRLKIMRYPRAAFFVSLVIVIGLAAAGDLPQRKPGLWEMSLSSPGSRRPPRISRYCIDAATAALMDNYAAGATQKTCRKNESHREGASIIIDSECTISSSKVTGRAVVTAADGDHVHVTIHSHFDPALFGSADLDTIQDSRWLGACPADMRPGDVITATGQKVNLKSVMGTSN